MKRLAVTGLVALLGCSSTEELEKKVEALEKEVASTRRALDRQADDLEKEISSRRSLERRLEDLAREQRRARDLATRPPPVARRAEPDPGQTYAVPVDGVPVLGPPDAKITMVVAYDYACMYCEKVQSTLAELRQKYGANMRMVFHQQVIHPRTAMASALAACAANKQGKFVQMDQLLWKAFRDRTTDTDRCWESAAGCTIVDGFARQLGLSMTRYKADVRACTDSIADEMRELAKLGVSATPAFFVNGRYMSGARPADSFAMLIDEELAKAEARIQAGTPKAAYYRRWVLEAGLPRLEPAAPATTGP